MTSIEERIKQETKIEKERVQKLQNNSVFGKNLWKYYQFISWGRFFPDLFIELFKSVDSNIQLHLDQRVFLRSSVRFFSMYGTFSRGSGKTFLEIMSYYVVAILFPNITLSITAQTKENAAGLIAEKTEELLKMFPLLENEIEYKRTSKSEAYIKFKSGSAITNLANAQSSKGRRRNRINIEESALLNNALFEDALEPIVEVPRITCGSKAIIDPEEMNSQINFFTTAGFRGSDEYNRSLGMVEGMKNMSGDMVIGSSWILPCYYGRGRSKSQILKKKKSSNYVFFAQNYEQEWVGCADNALVDVNKLMATRTLENPVLEIQKDSDEFYITVDVARSENKSNNQSAINVLQVERNSVNKRVNKIKNVNVIGVSNTMNFKSQAILIKKLKKQYKAKMVIIDGNGLGSGLVDQLLLESFDPVTGESLGCFDTVNTDNKPEIQNAEKCVFDMKAQSYQTKVISYFIDAVENGILELLIRKPEQDFTMQEKEFFDKNVLPYVNTELLFTEIANLKLKILPNNNLTVEKSTNKVDKDKFSSLSYGIFYIMEFCNKERKKNIKSSKNISSLGRKPNLYKR